MRLLRVCKTRVLKHLYRDHAVRPKHYRTAMHRFSQLRSSTDLHAVACNLEKLKAGAKIGASYYRARFALSTGTADYLAT